MKMTAKGELVISIRDKLMEISNQRKQCKNRVPLCIYKVPGWLKDQIGDVNDTTPYTPEIISFGPYHRGDPTLAEMEYHKLRCLRIMLAREKQDIEIYVEEMRKLEAKTRACYQGPLKLDSNAFVEMLVLDGCFMLEFLWVTKHGPDNINNLKYDDDDPVFSKGTIIHVIARDMIKLENQIPIFVIEKLWEVQSKWRRIKDERLVVKLVLQALTPIWVTNEVLKKDKLKTMREVVASTAGNLMLHCLDIFRASLLYNPSLNLEKQRLVKVEQGMEMIDIDSSIRIQSPVNNIAISDQVEQHDQETGRPSFEDVSSPNVSPSSPLNLSMGTPDHSLHLDAQLESPESYVSSTNTGSSLDESEVQHLNAENESHKTSCVGNLIRRLMTCGLHRNKLFYEEIERKSELMVYCVKDLREAGVKFTTRRAQPFWELTFNRGMLEIPPIKIDDATKTVFLNLIAYEQCHLRDPREMTITAYVAFMDNLVNSGADVNHLHRAGIIVHQLGSDDEVADLFNRLVKKAFVDWKHGHLSFLYKRLNEYCKHRRYRWHANLRHVYLDNPWVIISLVFGTILFLLTIVQTFYAVLAYHRPSG